MYTRIIAEDTVPESNLAAVQTGCISVTAI